MLSERCRHQTYGRRVEAAVEVAAGASRHRAFRFSSRSWIVLAAAASSVIVGNGASANPFPLYHGAGASYRSAPLDLPMETVEHTVELADYELRTRSVTHEAAGLCAIHVIESVVPGESATPVDWFRSVYGVEEPRRWAILSFMDPSVPLVSVGHRSELLHPSSGVRSARRFDVLNDADRARLSSLDPALSPEDIALLQSWLPPPLPAADGAGAQPATVSGEAKPRATPEVWPMKFAGSVIHRLLLARPDATGTCPAAPRRTHVVYSVSQPVMSGPEGTFPVYASPHEAPAVELVASQTVRIEFVDKTQATKVQFCSGLLVAPQIVLSAAHCLLQCERDPRECASYAVDVGLRYAPVETLLSVPARMAEIYHVPNTHHDYGFLYLHESSHVRKLWDERHVKFAPETFVLELDQHGVWIREADRLLPTRQQMLAHPAGRPMLRSLCDRCAVRDEALAHTCYTEQGSSGGVLWLDHGQYVAALALHRRYVEECNGEDSRVPDWSAEMEARVVKSHLRVNRACLGAAVPIRTLWRQLCALRNATTEPLEGYADQRKQACDELRDSQLLRRPSPSL